MSNILNKISSIEADDDVAANALGLRPVDEDEPLKRVGQADKAAEADEPMPAIISRGPDRRKSHPEPEGRWPLFLMVALGLLWLITALFIANGFFDLSNFGAYDPLQLGGLTMFILFPLFLLGLLYMTLKQLSKITMQSHHLKTATNDLLKVDETVVRRATEMSGVVKGEISSLNAGIDTALTRAATLQGLLDDQMEKLGETSYAVEDKTKKITEQLATEREALWSISNTFDEQMKVLTETLDKHSENLAMSTKTAEQKIQEARVSVESTASKINTTSELVRNNTMEAASTLSDNQTEILRLSEQLKARAEELDTIYQKHGKDLNAMIAQLRNEQEVLSQSLEERLSKMRDVALSAQVSAERLTEASIAGRDTVTSLSEAAKISENTIKQRFTEMEEMVKYSNSRAESISEKASRRVQDSLAQTRKEIARIEADMLGLEEKLATTPEAPIISKLADIEATDDITPVQAEPSPEQTVKRKRGFLNLRPAQDETDDATQKSEPVGGLHPDPDPDMDLHVEPADIETEPVIEAEDMVDELVIPTTNDPDPKPETIVDQNISSTENAVPKSADQDATPEANALRRTISEPDRGGNWLKSLFSRKEKAAQVSAIDAITSTISNDIEPFDQSEGNTASVLEPAPVKTRPTETRSTDKRPSETDASPHQEFIKILEHNGLGPNAIVDTGTIIEAVKARLSGGSKQMSMTVADRLREPVSHFDNLINSNEDFKGHAINFAVKFHHSLAPHENNGESLRNHLESEDGRLFLMCDAALNT